jgi:hypothetical protein
MRIVVLLASALAASVSFSRSKLRRSSKTSRHTGSSLQVYSGEEGWGAAIVDVRIKKALRDLDVYGISAGVLETN